MRSATSQLKGLLTTVLLVLSLCSGCRKSGLPEPGSKAYADFCSAFYLGLAGLQAGEDVRAKEYLSRSTQIAPGEPSGWADVGILQMRQQQFDNAFANVETARSLSPNESRIEALLGLIESRRGKPAEAAGHLRKAVSLDSHNLKATYSLAEESERDATPAGQANAETLLNQILQQRPSNMAVLLEIVRLSARRGDAAEAKKRVSELMPLTANWPVAAKQQLATVQRSLESGNVRPAAIQVQFLRNVLLRVPSYREDLDEIKTPATLVAQPFTRFLRLPSPNSEPAEPDRSTHFEARPLNLGSGNKVSWIGPSVLDETAVSISWADNNVLHLASGATLPLPSRQMAAMRKEAIAFADLNYDFKADVAIATQSGLKIYQQQDPQHFRDITAESKIPRSVATGSYTGVWAFDVDLDGDLDLVLGAVTDAPVVLRNNGDGTFTTINPFQDMDGVIGFVAADLDGDGDPDVAMLDRNGKLSVFTNERLGTYRRIETPANLGEGMVALSAGDVNGDGVIDLVVLKSDSSLVRLSLKEGNTGWDSAEVVRASASPEPSLLLTDLDNNGALDVVVNDQVFLSDGKSFSALKERTKDLYSGTADVNSDGKLDLVGLDQNGLPVELINIGSKRYHWQVIRTKAAQAVGDQRINSFGIGGEIEVRSELLAQRQIINSPILHFGLGEHSSVQFARIVWPNGFIQAEFDLKTDQTVLAEQRIKGSCPMLFTWNGRKMEFLKDVGPWGSALGLNVNAQGKGIYGTREWFKIRGDQLIPRDGLYDLRITAEYWETYYMDHYSLLVVDHPDDAEVYTDERFALPSPVPNLVTTSATKPFARAIDDNGQDVTAVVRDLDHRYLDTFGRGQYQGLTRDHWLELQMPDDAPLSGPLFLVGQGWIHDTDATIVKAQAQNSKAHPAGLSIEVPDASGKWITVRDGLGFPKGRTKTIVLDISNIFRAGAPRKLRLRTNLELYWNKLAWGECAPDEKQIHVRHIDLKSAELRFRGFSLITKADPSSPELPNYDTVQQSDLRWRDQEGYATRYGEVRELLQQVDDRYVITSPGDELRMKFAAPAPPPAHWKRDFILICDGWVKDGDYNSTFAGTILPLPYHAMTDYVLPPTALEDDHAYRLHPADWQNYHTRYVTPHYFARALWNQ